MTITHRPTVAGHDWDVADYQSIAATLLSILESWHTLNETSGNRADSHSGGLTLTQVGTVGNGTGKVGNAATGFGTTNFLENSDAALKFGSDSSFGIAFWVRFNSIASSQGLLGADDTSGTRGYNIAFSSSTGKIRFSLYEGATQRIAEAATTIAINTWYFVVACYDASANEMSISLNNGTPVTATQTGGVNSGTGNFAVGGIRSGATTVTVPLDGLLDEVVTGSDVFDSDLRAYLYNGGAGRTYPG